MPACEIPPALPGDIYSDEPVPDSACFLCNSGMFTGKKRHTTPETEGGIANVADTKRAGLDHGGKDF